MSRLLLRPLDDLHNPRTHKEERLALHMMWLGWAGPGAGAHCRSMSPIGQKGTVLHRINGFGATYACSGLRVTL